MSGYHGPNPDRSQRRVTREQLDASRAAWDAGEYGDEWKPWRHLAAMSAGIIDPPQGTRWDSWADSDASERALLTRAIRDTPDALRRALTGGRCHTWPQVIREVLQHRDRLADDAEEREHRAELEHRDAELPRGQATRRLSEILDTIAGSR